MACACAILSVPTSGSERKGRAGHSARSEKRTAETTDGIPIEAVAAAQATPVNLEGSGIARVASDGSIAAEPPGTTVYSNEIDPYTTFYKPGPNQRMADDLALGSGGPCDLVFYDLLVWSQGLSSPYFDVSTVLWDGDPCAPASSVIAGTEAEFLDVPALAATVLELTLDTPVTIPGSVWLAATFSTDDSGWIFAEEAEIGFTGNFWSENDPVDGCVIFSVTGGEPHGGFWTNINCTSIVDPPGACCNDAACVEEAEVDCVGSGGIWQGAFTTCDPNPCLTGACCTGEDFTTCSESTEAECASGSEIFRAGAVCTENPCTPAFQVFENSFPTGFFWPIDTDIIWADDLVFGPGAPCQLSAFNLAVTSEGGGPFDVQMALWTNNDMGTPFDELDDLPLAPITGTATDFTNIPSDLTTHALMAGPFEGIALPDRAWLVFSTSSNLAGPLLGGEADPGLTRDAFAVFNDPLTPGVWSTNFWFNGFNPEGCPRTPPCNPAGSFHINVWCEGTPPTGACCSDVAGTCIDDITLAQCDGRWSPGATCEFAPFVPACGTSACCWLGNCNEMPPEQCESLGGDVARGLFCDNLECPRAECSGAAGDCFSEHLTPGCEDAFCCEAVCAMDPLCCTSEWDGPCAADAQTVCTQPLLNDHCADAEPITGEGDFAFDNSTATTDGPPHDACGDHDEEKQVFDDVWHCWTATCTDTVYLRTCGLTDADTKLAVYEGCDTCPPTNAALLACNDNFCGYDGQPGQSQVSFDAVAGQSYLIRSGTPFEIEGGPGAFNIVCGLPDNPACPGIADCCGAAGTAGCTDELCCETVCACDAFCCEVAWDDNCASAGVGGAGCGAEILCPALCGEPCPDGVVTFLDPPDGIIDARQPHEPANAAVGQGIDTILVEAPAGADNSRCWIPCETVVNGTPNEIVSIVDNGDNTFTLSLLRPISAGGLTAITYAADGGATYTATYISHPANVNADGAGNPNDLVNTDDLVALVDCCLNQQCQLGSGPEETPYRCDINRSGNITPADMLRTIDLLNGGDQYSVWSDTALPTGNGTCP